MLHTLSNPIWMLVIGTLSVARVVRLITHDNWPPMEWARPRIAARLGSWQEIMVCPFCCAPYVMAAQMGLWYWATSQGHTYWWLIPNLWAASMYVAAIVVAYDQPE